jgi:hypothetical protein
MITSRQRAAHSIMNRRHELRRARVLAHNAELADAFGLRLKHFKVGEKAWWYKPPETGMTQGPDEDIGKLSKKFKDYWVGPFTVLQVGPSNANGNILQANTMLLAAPAGPTRVNIRQCKPCRDPAVDTRPDSLPSDIGRYLLSRYRLSTPSTLDLEDVGPSGSWERHGIQSILRHRVIRHGTNQAQKLQYLVHWEGSGHEDSWEPESNLDGCPEVLNDYWQSLHLADVEVTDASAKCVKVARQRAKAAAKKTKDTAATHPDGDYQLPPSATVMMERPTAKQLKHLDLLKDMHFMQVWTLNRDTPQAYKQWFPGHITRVPARRQKHHRILFSDQPQPWDVDLAVAEYGTTQNAAEAKDLEWFLFGTAEQIAALQAAV